MKKFGSSDYGGQITKLWTHLCTIYLSYIYVNSIYININPSTHILWHHPSSLEPFYFSSTQYILTSSTPTTKSTCHHCYNFYQPQLFCPIYPRSLIHPIIHHQNIHCHHHKQCCQIIHHLHLPCPLFLTKINQIQYLISSAPKHSHPDLNCYHLIIHRLELPLLKIYTLSISYHILMGTWITETYLWIIKVTHRARLWEVVVILNFYPLPWLSNYAHHYLSWKFLVLSSESLSGIILFFVAGTKILKIWNVMYIFCCTQEHFCLMWMKSNVCNSKWIFLLNTHNSVGINKQR